ncbi:MAG: ABC transporter ATP-binding protein [Bryobacteraceae bacterium]
MSDTGPLLNCSISVDYPNKPGVLRGAKLEIHPEEILGLAGQSGSGKSTLSLAILRLLSPQCRLGGEIRFSGQELLGLKERAMRNIRGRDIALVLQSPHSALNPALQIGTQLREAWRSHAPRNAEMETHRISQLFESVDLPVEPAFLRRYPRQLSVGQAQRVLIAMALLHGPKLLIADEPTSALDPLTQSNVLQLFANLNRKLHMAILLISHDLRSLAALCDRIAILHEGVIVECGETRHVFAAPSHPYTRQLLTSTGFAFSQPRSQRESTPMMHLDVTAALKQPA